jgi:glycosyltransferase involved in cell wall biosynthesis
MQVGVVIPTYNRAKLLRVALESVLSQTVLPSEVVVVDDGSTDDTSEVVNEIARSSEGRVRLLVGPHRNERGKARNRGVEATGTPFVAFLDSDDVWLPSRLETQLRAWASTPSAGFGFCNVQVFDEAEPSWDSPHLTGDYNGYILGDILEEPRATSSTLIVRRDAFERVGGFSDLRANEDYELTLRLAQQYEATYVPDVLVWLRQHEGRTSIAQREMPMLDYLGIVRRFLTAHPELPREMRLRARHGLANVHFKLAQLYLQNGDRRQARKQLRGLIHARPWDRRAPLAYMQSWLPLTGHNKIVGQ